jgi:hypothetical protein
MAESVRAEGASRLVKISSPAAPGAQECLASAPADRSPLIAVFGRVGVLPRQGVLRGWPVQECLEALQGDTAASLSTLRSESRALCGKPGTLR